MKIVLRGKGLWRFVERVGEKMTKEEAQKKDLTLAYIFASASGSCKPAVIMIRCPEGTWHKLRSMFLAVLKAAVDAKITRLQNIQLEKREKILNYSNRVIELIIELDVAGHNVNRFEQKRALLCSLPSAYEVTAEHILESNFSFEDAFARLIVRESRILQNDKLSEVVSQMRHND